MSSRCLRSTLAASACTYIYIYIYIFTLHSPPFVVGPRPASIAEDEGLLVDEDGDDVAATATVRSSWDSADQDANPVWSATEALSALSEAPDAPPSAAEDPLEAYHAIAFDNEIAICDKPGIGVLPSHEHVDLIPGTNVPAYLGGCGL